MKGNKLFLVLVAIAAAVFYVFVCPWLTAQGYRWMCWLAMAVFVLIFIYGRAGSRRTPPLS